MKIPNIYLEGVFHDLFDMIEEKWKTQDKPHHTMMREVRERDTKHLTTLCCEEEMKCNSKEKTELSSDVNVP